MLSARSELDKIWDWDFAYYTTSLNFDTFLHTSIKHFNVESGLRSEEEMKTLCRINEENE